MYPGTKDILFTKQQMGHGKIETTLQYAQLLEVNCEDYYSAVAKTVKEACQLTEQDSSM